MNTVAELKQKAKELKVKGWWLLTKADLIKDLEGLSTEPLGVVASIPESQLAASRPESPPQQKHETVEEYLARGGKITELPAPEFPAPKPTKESTAMKKNPEKKTPRKIQKSIEAEIAAEVNAAPLKKAPRKVVHKAIDQKKRDALKSDKGSLITLSTLVEESGIEARIARRRLRNSDIEKPDAQWEWEAGHPDIARVKELLK